MLYAQIIGQTPMGDPYRIERLAFPMSSPPIQPYSITVWGIVIGVVAPITLSFTI